MATYCPHCGWPDAELVHVLSRHRTPAGETVWTRCACGSLQVRALSATGVRVESRGAPSETRTAGNADGQGRLRCGAS